MQKAAPSGVKLCASFSYFSEKVLLGTGMCQQAPTLQARLNPHPGDLTGAPVEEGNQYRELAAPNPIPGAAGGDYY